MKKIFVIYGTQNAGKTHTSWLVYNLLKTIGTKVFYKTGAPTEWTYNEVLTKIDDFLSDFRAILEINGHRVGVISSGDIVGDFRDLMAWAMTEKVEFLICCARKNNCVNSVHQELLLKYSSTIYKWYFKTNYTKTTKSDRILDAETVARTVFNDVKIFV